MDSTLLLYCHPKNHVLCMTCNSCTESGSNTAFHSASLTQEMESPTAISWGLCILVDMGFYCTTVNTSCNAYNIHHLPQNISTSCCIRHIYSVHHTMYTIYNIFTHYTHHVAYICCVFLPLLLRGPSSLQFGQTVHIYSV